MEYLANVNCRLCLNLITDGSFKIIEETIIEALDVLRMKLSTVRNKSVICTACCARLFAAFQFKLTCIDMENKLLPYVDPRNLIPVDLRKVFIKERSTEHLRTLLDAERICRLCMEVAALGFTPVEDVEVDMIGQCIPEINFRFSKEPVICATCLNSLNEHSSFLKNCLIVEEQIKVFQSNKDGTPCIKIEEIEIKSEQNYGDSEAALITNKWADNENQHSSSLDNNYFLYGHTSTPSHHQMSYEDPSNVIYQCNICKVMTNHKGHFEKHLLTHQKPVQTTQTYMCDTCTYQTNNKGSLKRHLIRHRDISRTEVFECDACDYKSKRKGDLRKHQLTHKDISETKIFECDECDYKTKFKNYLTRHQVTHKDISETEVFACDLCDHKTKYRQSLLRHRLVHKDIVNI